MEGFMSLRCCFFNECHGEGGDDNMFGTAMGTSESDTKCEDITFFQCWKQASPSSDSIYGFYKGNADVKDINTSRCISRTGVLAGNFNTVNEGALVRFIQAIQSEEASAVEIYNTPQTMTDVNIINNSFTHFFFYPKNAKLTVYRGCFFLNNRYTDYTAAVEAYDCVSDSYPKATIRLSILTVYFDANKCRISKAFTVKLKNEPLLLFAPFLF